MLTNGLMDAGVTGILLGHSSALGSGEQKIVSSAHENVVNWVWWIKFNCIIVVCLNN